MRHYQIRRRGIYNSAENSYKFQWKDTKRWALHFAVGAIVAHATLKIDGIFGLAILICFLAYEALEEVRVKDHSFKDVFGALLMLVAGGYVIFYWS